MAELVQTDTDTTPDDQESEDEHKEQLLTHLVFKSASLGKFLNIYMMCVV